MPKRENLPPLTGQERDALIADIGRLRQEEPSISGLEICRRLGPKYGLAGNTVRNYL